MGVADWDPNPYPDPRLKRGETKTGPATAPDQPAIQLPRPFPWSFHMRGNSNSTRVIVSTRQLRGPAIIKSLWLQWQYPSAQGLRAPGFGLAWADTPYPRSEQGVNVAKFPGTDLFELDFNRNDGIVVPLNETVLANYATTNGGPFWFPISAYIEAPEFYLAAYLDVRTATDTNITGVAQIFEQVDPADAVILLA